MLTLEEDEELTAASHWLLPAGKAAGGDYIEFHNTMKTNKAFKQVCV